MITRKQQLNNNNNNNKDLVLLFSLIFNRLSIKFHSYLFKEITKYLPTHCGSILSFDKSYSFSNSFICNHIPIYYTPIKYKLETTTTPKIETDQSYIKIDTLLETTLYITRCEIHKLKFVEPKMKKTSRKNRVQINNYYDIYNDSTQKINFLVNQEEKTKIKLSKNQMEESKRKRRKIDKIINKLK